MTWSQSVDFMNLFDSPEMDADGVSRIIGEIDMEEYAAWLKEHYGFDVQYAGQ